VAGSGFGDELVDDSLSPGRGAASGSEPRTCKLRLNFCGLIECEAYEARILGAMGLHGGGGLGKVQARGCGLEWCLSAARPSAGVNDEQRWNQGVRVLVRCCICGLSLIAWSPKCNRIPFYYGLREQMCEVWTVNKLLNQTETNTSNGM
jgi:hypothetical protein